MFESTNRAAAVPPRFRHGATQLQLHVLELLHCSPIRNLLEYFCYVEISLNIGNAQIIRLGTYFADLEFRSVEKKKNSACRKIFSEFFSEILRTASDFDRI